MTQDMRTGRYTRFIVTMLMLLMCGATEIWADDITVIIDEGITHGTVTSSINQTTRVVTLTVTPASDYKTKKDLILAEKMVKPDRSSAARRAPGLGTFALTGTDEWVTGATTYTFTVTEDYDGAYITVTFVPDTSNLITSLSEISNNMAGTYELAADIDASGFNGLGEFTGTLDGKHFTIHHLDHPLFSSTNGATIRNINFENVNITSGDGNGDAGAITSRAKGATRIYNCGILPTTTEYDADGNITGFLGSSVGGSGNVGGLVGKLEGNARVINCFSYAYITGGTTVAGIVGNIGNTAITQGNLTTVPMVVNCMFYGDITGGTTKYPVYGGAMIKNDRSDNKGVNPYNYFRKNASFDNNYISIDNYNRSWPAEDKNLTRFEYYRSILNGNRHLCTYWATDKAYASQTAADTALIAKWVLDPTIAPYPILKKWGKYPSVINKDPVYRFNPETKTYELRSDAKEWEGKRLRTITVYVNAGGHHAGTGATSKTLTNVPVLDMDTLNCDYGYAKIQLPYYNEVFGNPSEVIPAPSDDNFISKWNQRYGGNYKEFVVTGWDVSGGSTATDYNFADRNSYKDRVYAQGGYFYVPDGVESITITAHWGKAVYLSNRGNSIDRVKVTAGSTYKTDQPFTPAGTVSQKFGTSDNIFKPAGDACTIYGDLQEAITNLQVKDNTYKTVYDQAIVLVGNHQVKNGSVNSSTKDGTDANYDVSYLLDKKWHPFTFMSADFDIDDEPDFCLQLQFRKDVDRPGIQPIRFDFLPVVELGLAVRHDNKAYSIGIMIPQGHFEVTETALIHTTQFEYDGFQKPTRTIERIEEKSPVILNGGEFEMFTVRYHASNRTSYFLLGGNVWVHRFAPGAHPNTGNSPAIYLCPINVIGGQVKELYLSGLYRPELAAPDNQGNPYCFTDGGKFDIMAGAGYEKVSGDVTFIINHSKIGEFYGGGINGTNPIGGNIDVTINNSIVDKYCGGPKVGSMEYKDNGVTKYKTVTTRATGTTFGVYYGGGNGGNSYYRQLQRDGDMASSHIATWTNENYNWTGFTPLSTNFDDGSEAGQTTDTKKKIDNKGYHAEYEFEVFNQSNGVADQITQRGFIKWIQFGITKTGDVSNTLSECKILSNFYGGGNLATVDGKVTSKLTNTKIEGSVFGAGYSAAIPTFKVHNKTGASFPSIDFAGTITDGNIPYAPTVYEWTNEKLAGKDEAYMKANPTYQDATGKWYCYTWNKLENLGAVTGNVSLTIDGNTVAGNDGKIMSVGGSVYGGGEESAVGGTTTVSVSGGTIGAEGQGGVEYGNVYGGGKGKDDSVEAGLVKGTTTVTISGSPRIYHNIYGGGAYGSVGEFTYNANGMPTARKENTTGGVCNVTITGGTIGWNGKENGMIFGSSRGDVGAPGGISDKQAWVYDTNVIIGSDTGPLIKGSVYGGGENGHVFHDASVTINKGTIGITDAQIDGGAAYTYRGNVYGGGCGTDKYYATTVPDGHTANDGNGDTYNPLAGIVRGNATVTMSGGHVVHNVYGAGAMGSVGIANTDGTITNGLTTIAISGGQVGVDGKNGDGNVFGAARGDLSATGENLSQVRETSVTISSVDVKGSVYGGGEAGLVKENTTVTMNSGSVNQSVFGGGCLADVLGNTNVSMTDGYVFNGIFGGGYSGSVGTVTERIAKNYDGTDHDTSHAGCVGGRPSAFKANTGKCTVVVTGGQIGPIEVATQGMKRRNSENTAYDPVPEGWVWGGGCGIVADPADDPDTDFRTYVKETDVTIGGEAFILESIIGGGEFGRVLGDTHVTIQGNCQIGVGEGQVNGNKPVRYTDEQFVDPSTTTITTSNALHECSHYDYGKLVGGKTVYDTYDPYYDNYYGNSTNVPDDFKHGSTSYPSDGKTWIGCVFGGGSGYMPYEKTGGTGYGWIRSAGWVGGNTLVEIKGGHILTNVYGANEYTDVEGKSTVKMSGGTIGVPRTLEQIKKNPLNGNLFGGGKGDPRTHFNTVTNVDNVEIEITGGIIYGSVYGGGEDGHVINDVVTTIKKGTGEGKAPVIGCNKTLVNNGNVFGGGQGSPIALTAGVVGGNITLNIEDGFINGSVYGGGEIASVGTYFAMANDEKYGKMQDGDNHGCINVNLKGGTIEQNVYGGCMGTTENPALGVSKNVAVELNKDVADNAKGCAVKGSIFGCNNVNSSPEGTATVHVYKTQRAGKSRITNGGNETDAKVVGTKDSNGEFDLSTFDVQAVYGGGNMAAYVPKAENGSTQVIIEGCDRTSIGHVYGGGNAASTPATNVEVKGTFEIGELFGGGNGKDAIDENTPNPGANVGYKDYHSVENNPEFATKDARVNGEAFAAYRYGTGEATVNIKGGTIHRVFGGSNTKGNVRITALTMLEEVKDNGQPVCPLHVDEAYGGGKSAPMDAEAKLLMACIPGLKEVYGGAQAADVYDDVTLTITNGTFDRVFGGNNISGTIRGKITVNIEETGCKPIIIGELYGGGNLAAYSIYGYNSNGTIKESGDNPWADPQINVKSFTSIGNIYGGGYGTGAVMVGSPHVNINVVEDATTDAQQHSTAAFAGKTITFDEGEETEHTVTLYPHEAGKMGVIGNVFGGGNAAEVKGNTYVNIGTESTQTYVSLDDDPATEVNEKVKDVKGADIRGNVYGGGNNAQVSGKTNVQIGKRNE